MKLFSTYYFLFFTAVISYGWPVQYPPVGGSVSPFTLKANANGLPVGGMVYLTRLHGDRQFLIDSAKSNASGQIQFQFTEDSPTGMYRLVLGKAGQAQSYRGEPQTLDFIFNRQDIELRTNFNHPVDSIEILNDKDIENKGYFDYLHIRNDFDKKLGALDQTMMYYPNTDGFYNTLIEQFNHLQKEQEAYVLQLIKDYPNAFFTRVVKAQQFPFIDAVQSAEGKTATLKRDYFKASDLTDTLLLRTDVLSKKMFSFMALYRSGNYTREEQEREFIKAVDVLLPLAQQGHPEVYEFVLGYLIRGFEKIQQENVLVYISDNYVENSCVADQWKEKLKSIKTTAVGQPAAEIAMADIDGKPVELYGINAQYTLVLFWASWCGHCVTTLPEIKKIYEQFNPASHPVHSRSNIKERDAGKPLEILAFSLDTDSALWKSFITQNGYTDWINCSELGGWDSEAAKNYNIYATPTMFLLDENKKIISKPGTVRELAAVLSGYL